MKGGLINDNYVCISCTRSVDEGKGGGERGERGKEGEGGGRRGKDSARARRVLSS